MKLGERMGKDYALPAERVCLAGQECTDLPAVENGDVCTSEKKCNKKDCLTGCAATFREAMEEVRKKKEEREAEKEDELREIRRPAKSFCVARLVTAGDPEPLEGVYKQVEVDNWEQYLEVVGAGKMTAGMIMKADRMVTISRQLDKQWLIRCECKFKAKSMKGFNTAVPGKVVENKYQAGVPRRELLQDWDLRDVETTLEYFEGSPQIQHGNQCCCAGADCPSNVAPDEQKLCLTQVVLETSKQPGDLVLEYLLDPGDQDTLVIRVIKEGQNFALSRLKRQKDTRRISVA